MANFLKRFKQNITKKEEAPVEADFKDYKAEISPQGDFQITTDLDCILYSWKNILMTPTRTYIFDPEFGSDIYKYVFEPMDAYTVEGILKETATKLDLYDNRMTVADTRVLLLTNEKGFGVEIQAEYNRSKKKFIVPILEDLIMDLEVY